MKTQKLLFIKTFYYYLLTKVCKIIYFPNKKIKKLRINGKNIGLHIINWYNTN